MPDDIDLLAPGLAELFRPYSAVALMANSEGLDVEAVCAALPADTLFVFFTSARVLSRPFRRDALLCHRMKNADRTIQGDRKMRRARTLFADGRLKAEIGLFAGRAGNEKPSASLPARSDKVDFLIDAHGLLKDWYTAGKTPTTGFALAIWLSAAVPSVTIYLCGFTGVRGADFRMRTMHDWTLEQIILRLLYGKGRIVPFARPKETDMGAAVKHFLPDIGDADIALVAANVASDRLNALDVLIAKLWSLASVPLAITNFTDRLRWKRLRNIGRATKK